MDLVEFLKARLDEDRQAAERSAGPMGYDWIWHENSLFNARRDDVLNVRFTGDMQCGEHIARHDPARVLREVEAQRVILRGYEENQPPYADARQQERHEELEVAVLALASIWSDHPDYDLDEWAWS